MHINLYVYINADYYILKFNGFSFVCLFVFFFFQIENTLNNVYISKIISIRRQSKKILI